MKNRTATTTPCRPNPAPHIPRPTRTGPPSATKSASVVLVAAPKGLAS